MKPLASHKRCCITALDRARHGLDRAEKALAFDEKIGREPRRNVLTYRGHCIRTLHAIELEALRRQ